MSSYEEVKKRRFEAEPNVVSGQLLLEALAPYRYATQMDRHLVGKVVKLTHGTYGEVARVVEVVDSYYRGSISSADREFTAESGWSVFTAEKCAYNVSDPGDPACLCIEGLGHFGSHRCGHAPSAHEYTDR